MLVVSRGSAWLVPGAGEVVHGSAFGVPPKKSPDPRSGKRANTHDGEWLPQEVPPPFL